MVRTKKPSQLQKVRMEIEESKKRERDATDESVEREKRRQRGLVRMHMTTRLYVLIDVV